MQPLLSLVLVAYAAATSPGFGELEAPMTGLTGPCPSAYETVVRPAAPAGSVAGATPHPAGSPCDRSDLGAGAATVGHAPGSGAADHM